MQIDFKQETMNPPRHVTCQSDRVSGRVKLRKKAVRSVANDLTLPKRYAVFTILIYGVGCHTIVFNKPTRELGDDNILGQYVYNDAAGYFH